MKTVLLTDGLQRKTLAAARSLGKNGVCVFVSEKTAFNTAAFSKHTHKSLVYPDPVKNTEEFAKWLMKTIRHHKIDMLIPMDDCTLAAVMKYRSELDRLCHLPLPPQESYLVACNKAESARFAVQSGIDCPKTVVPDSLDNLHTISSELEYPVVIKPRQSSGSRGIKVINNSRHLTAEYRKTHNSYPFPIIQEYIGNGTRYDVCLLYGKTHEAEAAFVQKEIRHFPLKMGPSTVQESVYLPHLIEKSRNLMKNLKWYGVVEIEYMVDERDGKFKFMEINPRFWNSLQMSILAGVDFPVLLFKHAAEGSSQKVFKYDYGIKCRWSLPGDLLHFLTNRKRFNMDPPLFSGKKHNIYDDIISFDDPLPSAGFFLSCLRYLFSRKMWKIMFFR